MLFPHQPQDAPPPGHSAPWMRPTPGQPPSQDTPPPGTPRSPASRIPRHPGRPSSSLSTVTSTPRVPRPLPILPRNPGSGLSTPAPEQPLLCSTGKAPQGQAKRTEQACALSGVRTCPCLSRELEPWDQSGGHAGTHVACFGELSTVGTERGSLRDGVHAGQHRCLGGNQGAGGIFLLLLEAGTAWAGEDGPSFPPAPGLVTGSEPCPWMCGQCLPPTGPHIPLLASAGHPWQDWGGRQAPASNGGEGRPG